MISVNEEIIPIQARFAEQYNLKLVLNELGNPENSIPTIHVVGTNGKGSTAYFLSQGLKKKYQKVGLFISPAFLYHNERIQIDNQMISDDDLKAYLKKIEPWIFTYHLTFFEIWTLIMILYFADQDVSIAVIEAGIGGEKDATNVFENQLMVLLTAVGLDHTEILGETIDEILNQKLGIAKPKTPVLISADNLPYVNQIDEILKTKELVGEWTLKVTDEIVYQQANKGIVVACLLKLGIEIDENFDWTPPLGRFTILKNQPKLILDGAHNLAGIEQLINTLHYQKIDPIILYATSAKKDYQQMLEVLNKNFVEVYITDFSHFKAWETNQINYPLKVEDWQKFLLENQNRDVVVCGSLYFIPQIYQWYFNNLLNSKK